MLEYDVEKLTLDIRKLKREKGELKETIRTLKKEDKKNKKRIKELKSRSGLKNRIKRIIKALIRRVKKTSQKELQKTVTAIIPTYKEGLAYDTINSVLKQDYPERLLSVIVAFNGADTEYLSILKEKYKNEERVKILECPKQGLGAARNHAVKQVTTNYLFFLDDDDYLTEQYISDAMQHASAKTSIIVTRMDNLEDGELVKDTYINNAIDRMPQIITAEKEKPISLYTSMCGKIYKTKELQDTYSAIPEDMDNSEDVRFWVDNIGKIRGETVTIKEPDEAYIRRVTEDSMSRPSEDRRYKVFVTDKLFIIDSFKERLLKKETSPNEKKFILNMIQAQTKHIQAYLNEVNDTTAEAVYREIKKSDNVFLNKSLFGKEKGIAFCHNFSPYIDASAMVATKRLQQISEYFDEIINWNVITSDMSLWRKEDALFDSFFARQQYTNKYCIGKARGHEYSQYLWGCAAVEKAEELDIDVKYIYSRTMWLGSHIAAFQYKQRHPEVIWVAEFSDPLYMDANYRVRKTSEEFTDEKSFLNTIYRDTELNVYNYADRLIFTNENQFVYMMEMNPPEDREAVKKKTLIWNHPQLPEEFNSLIYSKYKIDKSKINIAYFGTFYKARNIGQILDLLNDERIVLYIFTNRNDETDELEKKYSNLVINDMIPLFEMQNLASQMDYCCLADLEFDGPINPYLPSKLSDYLAAGSKVIALNKGNSIISKSNNPSILKTEVIDKTFLNRVIDLANTKNVQDELSHKDKPSSISIALAADSNYAIPLLVTLESLVSNADENTSYNIALLSSGLTDTIIRAVNDIMESAGMPQCTVFDFGDQYRDVPLTIEHTASPTFFRLRLPELLKDDKCIYLDTDTIVKKDLSDLYCTCPDESYIAGVKAAAYYKSASFMKAKARALSVPLLDEYINAGVIVMNLRKLREDNMCDAFSDLLPKNFSSQDQDIINAACYGGITTISPKYNSMTKYDNTDPNAYYNEESLMVCYNAEDWKEACEDPVIIHYADNRKPWNTKDVRHYTIWKQYYDQLVNKYPAILETISLPENSNLYD